MNKLVSTSLFIIFWTIICLGFGYFAGSKLTDPVIIQGETVWKDKVVYRNYSTMTILEKDKILECYDKGEFFLAFDKKENNEYRITGNLCEREAYKDIKIEVGESNNWKLYIGIGSAVAIGAGIYVGLR